MKLFINTLFLLVCSTLQLHSQDVFSKYEKYDFEKLGEKYRKILKINDPNSLIIKLNRQKFVYTENDGFYACIIDEDEKLLIEKKKLSSNDSLRVSANLTSMYSINPNTLNEIRNGDVEMTINDGVWYEIGFYKKDCFLELKSYSPKEYIQHKVPYYQERMLLVNFIDNLYGLFKNFQTEKIKNSKDIYIIYNEVNSEEIIVDRKKVKNQYTFHYTESKQIVFNSNEVDKNNLSTNLESLLLTNNNEIVFISAADLHKNGYAFLSNLAKEKRIFILNKKDLKKENIVAKRLYLSSF